MIKPPAQKVCVIGAGFSGLLSAYYLEKAGFEVEVFEALQAPGGLIHSFQTPHGLVETAANGLLNSVELEEICDEIGVELKATQRTARKRYIFRDGRARRFPLSFSEALRFVKFLLVYFLNRKAVRPRPLESIAQWGERVLGKAASHYTIEAALQGIYAGEPSKLSASLILRRLFWGLLFSSRSQKPRLGRGTVSPLGGMAELITKLCVHLSTRNVPIYYGEKISSAFEIESDCLIVLATSAPAAADFLKASSDSRAYLLNSIEMIPLTTTTVFSEGEKPLLDGFGLLFPGGEGHKALGVLMNKQIFGRSRAETGQSETWITPGVELEDSELIDVILLERNKISNTLPTVVAFSSTRWKQALPHYTVELERALSHCEILEGRVALMGNYLGEIGLKQILLRAKALPGILSQRK